MRFSFDIHLSLGKDDEPEPTPNGDAIGYPMEAGPALTGLGFHIPGPRLDPGQDDHARDNGTATEGDMR